MVTFTPGGALSVAGFLVLVGFVLVFFLRAVSAARKKSLKLCVAALVIWLGGLGIFGTSSWVSENPVPGFPLFFAFSILPPLALALSPFGLALANFVGAYGLIAFQAFRFPLELILHAWVLSGTIPETMTWSGKNFDVVIGILAVVVWIYGNGSRKLAWAFNVIGLGLLLNVMRVALFSTPVPFGWNTHPPLMLAAHAPYYLIAPVCVGGALCGHVLLTRLLLKKRRSHDVLTPSS